MYSFTYRIHSIANGYEANTRVARVHIDRRAVRARERERGAIVTFIDRLDRWIKDNHGGRKENKASRDTQQIVIRATR